MVFHASKVPRGDVNALKKYGLLPVIFHTKTVFIIVDAQYNEVVSKYVIISCIFFCIYFTCYLFAA